MSTVDAGTAATSLYGQGPSVVGRYITAPWFPSSWRVNQGWGPTDYAGEPEGHGYPHWHAGVDVGLDCGTDVHMPSGLLGVARWVDNPGGYGTALRLELYTYAAAGKGTTRKRTVDIWLGHLRQRLIQDGAEIPNGAHLATSNNTGNSTGCHLHFEVRPAGAKYGTDIDPTGWLLIAPVGDAGQTQGDGNPYNPLDPRYGFWEVEHEISGGITTAEHVLLALGQAALGTLLLVGGLAIVIYGLRGQNLGNLRADVVKVATRRSQEPPEAPQTAQAAAKPGEATPEPTGADVGRQARLSRIRVSHQAEIQRGGRPTPGSLPPARARERMAPDELQRRVQAGQSFSQIRNRRPEGTPGPARPAAAATRLRHPRRGSFRLRAS